MLSVAYYNEARENSMSIHFKTIKTYLWAFSTTGNEAYAIRALDLDEKLTSFIAIEMGIVSKLPGRMDRLKESNVVRL